MKSLSTERWPCSETRLKEMLLPRNTRQKPKCLIKRDRKSAKNTQTSKSRLLNNSSKASCKIAREETRNSSRNAIKLCKSLERTKTKLVKDQLKPTIETGKKNSTRTTSLSKTPISIPTGLDEK